MASNDRQHSDQLRASARAGLPVPSSLIDTQPGAHTSDRLVIGVDPGLLGGDYTVFAIRVGRSGLTHSVRIASGAAVAMAGLILGHDYLRTQRRLPGSTRTKRLRKKREQLLWRHSEGW